MVGPADDAHDPADRGWQTVQHQAPLLRGAVGHPHDPPDSCYVDELQPKPADRQVAVRPVGLPEPLLPSGGRSAVPSKIPQPPNQTLLPRQELCNTSTVT